MLEIVKSKDLKNRKGKTILNCCTGSNIIERFKSTAVIHYYNGTGHFHTSRKKDESRGK